MAGAQGPWATAEGAVTAEWLVVNTINFPNSLSLMSINEFPILQLQIPFGARPGFFAPPVSGKQIWPALIDDFSGNFRTANVCEGIFIQQE